ncbi:CLUMA_CG000923, isoform A [Clunio marinus]|uniref:CLUMA_CG000923, isoform A n=1 Tax=Clunio marinus TaxID=568069 RepID=A0A1J1HKV7_9DIPT|nr:CLUMA_CG000923, isoform A [Clunio marinus]
MSTLSLQKVVSFTSFTGSVQNQTDVMRCLGLSSYYLLTKLVKSCADNQEATCDILEIKNTRSHFT